MGVAGRAVRNVRDHLSHHNPDYFPGSDRQRIWNDNNDDYVGGIRSHVVIGRIPSLVRKTGGRDGAVDLDMSPELWKKIDRKSRLPLTYPSSVAFISDMRRKERMSQLSTSIKKKKK